MHDAVLNAASAAGHPRPQGGPRAGTSPKQQPPRKARYTSLAEVMRAPVVAGALEFQYVHRLHQQKGGPAFPLLQHTGGVYLIVSTIYGDPPTPHAFRGLHHFLRTRLPGRVHR